MKLAVSNIALPAYDHADELAAVAEMGLDAVEVAPSRVWHETWKGLTPTQVSAYRRQVETAGLAVVGLHSLLFDHKDLGLFKDGDTRARTLDFFVHLSGVCRDLGGETLIWGGGRHRGEVPYDDAMTETLDFFGDLSARIAGHGTCFCLEPLGPNDTDFIHSARESLAVVDAVNSPALAVQLDAKALVDNDEAGLDIFETVKTRLVHFHANEPGLNPLGTSGSIDHVLFGECLQAIGYDGYVSIEQKMIDETNPLDAVRRSAAVLRQAYGRGDA